MRRIRSRLTYANVMVTVLLFAVLGGGAYAVATAPKNSVLSKSIKNGEVKVKDLGDAAVTEAKLGDGSVTGAKLGNGSVTEAKLNAPATFASAGLTDAFGTCGGAVGNNWGSFSPDVNNTVSYYRDPTGIVHLRGIAIRCNAAGLVIFTLPAGYRPDRQNIEAAWTSAAIAQRLQIQANGNVDVLASFSPGSWVSLDGLTFRCGPAGASGCP